MSVSVINQSTRAYTIAKAANITENDLNTRDSNGRTVLFYAARYGKAQAVKNLLNAGSDPNIHDVEESTPLHEAVERCHTEVVKILIKNVNTDINAKNKLGQTPLIKAVGQSLEEPDSAGKTPVSCRHGGRAGKMCGLFT
ncbi:hypothetical protein KUTeg_001495 [Tegillarca granosa]|uniref:Uncharacterized protein n=1 Tax=Tegillarca granosa TaxID=220873 RepID=A0ABQ9FRK8_TEGGR|nr:hypothetical protein KUTeg_001495 [Tegillarca granosa]